MKRFLLFPVLVCAVSSLFSQSGQWTWMQGDNYIPQIPVYGTQGQPGKDNKPGARQYATNWKDADGNLWLFGGSGYSFIGNGGTGYLNDLWKYTPSTGQWTWMGGDKFQNFYGVYGTKGAAAPGNKPGARQNGVGWTDAAGNLWLFGGFGCSSPAVGYLNDLWKFSPATGQWTWVSGDSTENQRAVYGGRGTAAATNKPGARQNSAGWADGAGNLWLFGGMGYANYGASSVSDLWKFSPSTGQWTWVSGDTTIEAAGVYGVKGTANAGNKPGARYNAVSWTDAAGSLWLFGGYGYEDRFTFMKYLNDLWKFTPATGQWTWISGDNTGNQPAVYGSRGVPAPGNKPGGRQDAVSWTDAAGNLWLHGGGSYTGTFYGNALDDLWKYDPATGLWTWMDGYGFLNLPAFYGEKNNPSPDNRPGSRYSSVSWADAAGNLWLSGGFGYINSGYGGVVNDLWKYTIATGQWTWVSGDNQFFLLGVYGSMGIAAASNKPGGRQDAAAWTDAAGNLWMFGGSGYATNGGSFLNDFWKYTPATGQWTWVNGSDLAAQAGFYGRQGEPSSFTIPGCRSGSGTWKDAAGNLWLFGGQTYSTTGPPAYLNDLWKYTSATEQWTWVSGSNAVNQTGRYGSKGTAAAINAPGARQYPATWTDALGNEWLFGGKGYAGSGFAGGLNDLWKYTTATSEWAWMGGDSVTEQTGVYGLQGNAAAGNKPGARANSTSWLDAAGNLWLFGGEGKSAGRSGILNDLWKYSTSTGQWAWMAGDSTPRKLNVYDPANPASPGNKPSSRLASASWTDASGNLWLFGGDGYTSDTNFVGSLNDVWMYAPSTGRWTWKDYNPLTPYLGVYGTRGTPAPDNIPGTRSHSARWLDAGGKLWLLGGAGYAANGSGLLNDLWQYTMPLASLPVQLSSFSARKQQQEVLLGWTTAQEQNSRYFVVERSSSGLQYDSIGSVAAAGWSAAASSYAYVDKQPLAGTGYYRLKQTDRDGKWMYSSVATVVMAGPAAGFAVVQNPASSTLQLLVQLPAAQKFSLQIRDMNGQLLLSRDYVGRKGNSMVVLPVTHLGHGPYLINMQTGNAGTTKIFMKQ